MAFRYYGQGNFLPASMKDGKLKIKFNDNSIIECDIGFKDVEFKEQVNYFRSYKDRVLLILENETLRLIGRVNGTASLYKKDTGLLIRNVGWTPPKRPLFITCGTYFDNRLHTMTVCAEHPKILYQSETENEYVLRDMQMLMGALSENISDAMVYKTGLFVKTAEGRALDAGTSGDWFIQVPDWSKIGNIDFR